MNNFNLVLDTDSYKSSHFLQYPPNTTKLVAYLESRGGVYKETIFFGLQYIIKKYLTQKITINDVNEAQSFFSHHHLPFNKEGWLYIAKNLNGIIPLKIYAVPEGTAIPTHNILIRIESTDPKCFWVVTWFETILMRVWYPITVATLSWHIKKLVFQYLQKTSDNPEEEISFKVHDFGARGVSSAESASIGGASHLVNFSGSDTILGMLCANEYYSAHLSPSSIPAAEHSCIMVWGKNNEENSYKHILTELSKHTLILAMPVDTYNFYQTIKKIWGKTLVDNVKKSGAIVVLRTDSGKPEDVVLKTLQTMEKVYGSTINKKGYKVLNNIRILHSNSVNYQTIEKILKMIFLHKYSVSNIVFGIGGALLQKLDRDTQKIAYKVALAKVDGKFLSVSKNPITAKGKKSKSGYLDLIKTKTGYKTIDRNNFDDKPSELILVFNNGKLLVDQKMNEIRKRSMSYFK